MNSDVPALLFDKVDARASNGSLVLRAVDLVVPQRGLFGIVGPNGAGKSSLLRAVIGLLPLVSGRLSIAGRTLSDWAPKELARVIGYMPQKVHSHWDLRVSEILQVAGSHSWAELLDRLELGPLLDRSFNNLSGGEQARVAMARALSHQPDILLADEPVAHLDLPHQHELLQHLRAFSAARTIVIVLHDFHLASRYCDQVAMISGGSIRRCGKPQDVLSATFLSEIYGKPVDTVGEGARHFFTMRT